MFFNVWITVSHTEKEEKIETEALALNIAPLSRVSSHDNGDVTDAENMFKGFFQHHEYFFISFCVPFPIFFVATFSLFKWDRDSALTYISQFSL